MEWQFPVAEQWYDAIASGSKVVEGRVPDPSKPAKDYSKLVTGDIAVISAVDAGFKPVSTKPELKFVIGYNRKYPSVEEMVNAETLARVVPGVPTIESAKNIYHSFPGYEERIKLHGIHAIGLESRL